MGVWRGYFWDIKWEKCKGIFWRAKNVLHMIWVVVTYIYENNMQNIFLKV